MRGTDRRVRPIVAVAVLAVATCGIAAGVATAGSVGGPRLSLLPDHAAAAGQAAAARRTTAQTVTTVTLPTGTRVDVTSGPDGASQAQVEPGSSHDGSFSSFTLNGDTYVIPASAVRYLGSQLDPSLFDVTALARTAKPGPASIPVRVAFSGSNRSVTGIAFGGSVGAVADGTLSAAGAAEFGAYLHRLAARGATRLPGVTTMTTPAGTRPAARPAAGGLPFDTLSVSLTDQTGSPGVGYGVLQNLDDPSRAAYLVPVSADDGGRYAVSVPDGNYSVVFDILTPHPGSTLGFDSALVADPQFAVGPDVSLSLDARQATIYHPVVTGYQPPDQEDLLALERSGRTGGKIQPPFLFVALALTGADWGSNTLSIAPTQRVTEGTFEVRSLTQMGIDLGATQTAAPVYVLSTTAEQQVPASLDFAIPPSQLTTVREDIHSPTGGPVQLYYAPTVGWTAQGFATYVPVGPRVDYLFSADPATELWVLGYLPPNDPVREYGAGFHALHGATVQEVWGKGPFVPSPHSPSYPEVVFGGGPGADVTACVACRQDDNGTLEGLIEYSDSDPTHQEAHYDRLQPRETVVDFYRDGQLALTSSGTFFGELRASGLTLPLLPGEASYELHTQSAGLAQATARVDTVWTFSSGPDDATGGPRGAEVCAPDDTRGCTFLPLLFLTYDLPLDDADSVPAGAGVVPFVVSHQQGEAAPTGVTATVSLSTDHGKTWSAPLAAHSSSGGFQAAVTNPPSGSVSLRVVARDAAGESITQTTVDAYTVH